jgi:hypothetical protein
MGGGDGCREGGSLVIELLLERKTKLLPTAPLHSSGWDLDAQLTSNVVMGYKIREDSDYAKKLAGEYVKHRECRESKLAEMVVDPVIFCQNIQRMLNEEDTGTAWYEQQREREEDPGVLNKEGLLFVRGACIITRLKELGFPADYFYTQNYLEEDNPLRIDTIYVGHRIESLIPGLELYLPKRPGDPDAVIKELRHLRRELEKIKIPPEFEPGLLSVFLDGNGISVLCYG